MRRMRNVLLAVILVALSGCASRQEVTRLESRDVRVVCIVEHAAVQSATLDAIRDGVTKRGFEVRVVKGTYEHKHSSWIPTFRKEEVYGCGALLFYVANWNWDLAYYMRYANIWMTDASGTRRLAQASYDASTNVGVGKFIVARDKLLELVDQMLSGVTPMANTPVATVPSTPRANPAIERQPTADAKGRLTQLEELRRQGLVSEDEYLRKRQAILDSI